MNESSAKLPKNKFKQCRNIRCREDFKGVLYSRCPKCNANLDNFFVLHPVVTAIISGLITSLLLYIVL